MTKPKPDPRFPIVAEQLAERRRQARAAYVHPRPEVEPEKEKA